MKQKFLLTLIWCLLVSVAWAQTRSVSGRVTGPEGASLPGVTVLERGTTNGTSTNVDGAFSLTVQPNATLVVSSIGYESQTVLVGNNSTLNVTLKSSATQLNEAVVVGYGTQAKADLTGSIAQVSGREIENQPVTTFEQAIQGKAAGVFIENSSGKLGQSVKVRVRGTSSVSGGTQPLYVIDGIPIVSESNSGTSAPTNPIADLNPNDIESINILKDASASAIYGSRASNGVIIITTRRGKSGATHFNLGFQTGSSEPTRRKDFLNSTQYLELIQEAAANENVRDPSFDYVAYTNRFLTRYAAGNADYANSGVSTDWQDQVLRKTPFSQYDLSASGGNDKTRFYLSGLYSKQNGILVGNKFEKMSARLNLDHKATDKLSLGVNINLSRTVNNRLDNDNSFGTPLQIVALTPITPLIDPRTGLLSGSLDPATGLPNTNYPVYYNPLLSINNAYFNTTVYRTLGNVFAQYEFIKGLTFRSELGIDLINQNEDNYSGLLTARNTDFTSNGNGTNSYLQNNRFTTNNYFSYRNIFAERHSVEAVAGMSFEGRKITANSVSGQQFPSDAYRYIASAALINAGSSSSSSSSLLSYFGRVNYAFASKYLLTLSGRIDGSSRFGRNNQYGFFPAASIGWMLTEEAFLKDQTVLSTLKPRASIGKTGNQTFPDFISRALYSAGSYAGTATQRLSQFADPNLKWESTTQIDAGIEFGFLDNRITGEVDVYQKKTDGLVLNVNVPSAAGLTTRYLNVGSLQNKGFEFVLTTQNAVGAFTWTTNFNAATNRNKITNLQGQVIEGGYVNRAVEGQPIGVFFTKEYAGVDPANGDALYYLNTKNADGSINRNTTSDYNAAERIVLGNPNPKWTGGVTNTLGYKGVELNFTFQGVFGNKVFDGGGQYQSANGSNGFDNQTANQLKRWQNPGDITDVPQARLFEGNGVGNSSRYIYDGSYVRLKTTTLSYSLPKALVSKAHFDHVRVYLTGVNLLTFTDYKGWDPEVNADYLSGNIAQGNDFYSAPQAKTYTIGVNIGF
ncbi:TonB-dependent receptor [Hymenobacter sp. GOD-10R]|uniref:SusC/RagA family TonB-linked outer membrane protein n=1 Tax=Hymenobacter sp. GOD-10R TaxID=3093922 RepID=UPI002D76771C|nr:TonB-dependent receptor [Hymenobacter sp. GOD-10R]WRQ29804.1 TonB-dependent receptor [Hymenobacter sp. GOD-10R]